MRYGRYFQGGLLAAAVAVWAAAPAKGGESVFFRRGVVAFSGRRYVEAAVHFKAALRENPADPDALYYLGLALYHAGRPGEALEALERCGRLEPDFKDYVYHYYKGAALFRQRLYLQAAEEFAESLRLHPGSRLAPRMKRLLEQIREHAGTVPDETVRWYEEAAGKGLAAGRAEWAERFAREAFLLRPASRKARLLLARARYEAGRFEGVPEVLSSASSAEELLLLARALERLGRLREAFSALKGALGRAPEEAAEALRSLAAAAETRGDRALCSEIRALLETPAPGKRPAAPERRPDERREE